MEDNKKLYTVNQVRNIIPLSTSAIYKACSEKRIPVVKVGSKLFIPAWYIDNLVNEPKKKNEIC